MATGSVITVMSVQVYLTQNKLTPIKMASEMLASVQPNVLDSILGRVEERLDGALALLDEVVHQRAVGHELGDGLDKRKQNQKEQ